MSNIVSSGSRSVKSFWERPEGKTGMIVLGLLAFAFFIAFGNVILPFVITALQNTIHALILGAILLSMVTLALNDKFRFLISNIFKSAMRAITGLFISIDPIGILKNYIDLMDKKIIGIEGNIQTLTGQKRNIKENMLRAMEEKEENLRLSSAAKKQGKDQESILYSRKAARSQASAEKFEVIHDKMEVMYKVLDRMKKAVKFLLEDTKDEVRVKEIEYKSIKAAHRAMSSAQDLINGSSERELFEQSMEFLAEDLSIKLGEMDRFMDLSEGFLSGVDIQNGAMDEKGLQLLAEWEAECSIIDYEAGSLQKKDDKALPAAQPSAAALIGQSKTGATVSSSGQYSSLFKKN